MRKGHVSRVGKSLAEVEVRFDGKSEHGLGLVLERKPLTLLLPSHVVCAILNGQAEEVLVDGEDCGLPFFLRDPGLTNDELTVVRFAPNVSSSRPPARLPKRVLELGVGDDLTLISARNGRVEDERGVILGVSEDEGYIVYTAGIHVDHGDSGSVALHNGELVAVQFAMDWTGRAMLQQLRPDAIPDVVGASRRRVRKAAPLLVGAALVLTAVVLLVISAGRDPATRAGESGNLGQGATPDHSPSASAVALDVSEGSAIYVYYGESVWTPFREELVLLWLEEVGFSAEACDMRVDPIPDLSSHDLLVVHVTGGRPPETIPFGSFLADGKGIVILEATWFFLGGVPSWAGSSTYANGSGTATAVVDHPFGTAIGLGEAITTEASWGGPAAMRGLSAEATAVARWSNGDLFAYAYPTGDARVYYHAAFGGAVDPIPNAVVLFKGGARWAYEGGPISDVP